VGEGKHESAILASLTRQEVVLVFQRVLVKNFRVGGNLVSEKEPAFNVCDDPCLCGYAEWFV
jgi:hypothetical protein